ncbi:MAG: hypothetical protein WCW68_14465 [Methanothrix sp.]
MPSFEVTVQAGKHDFDCYEIEATSQSEAWIKGARIAKSPLVMRVKEVI